MNITDTTRIRCKGCGLYKGICICRHIVKNSLSTRLTLLIHSMELRKVSNTGRLARLCLENSAMFIRGKKGIVWNENEILPGGYEHRILFPNANQVLTPDMRLINGKPINLIVPDGNWHQAKRMIISEPYLQKIKRVKLVPRPSVHHYVRKAAAPGKVSTLEAVARAYGLLENTEIQNQLENVLTAMNEKLNKIRGYRPGQFEE